MADTASCQFAHSRGLCLGSCVVIISVVSVVYCVLCGVLYEMCMYRLSVCTDCLLIVLSFMCLVGGGVGRRWPIVLQCVFGRRWRSGQIFVSMWGENSGCVQHIELSRATFMARMHSQQGAVLCGLRGWNADVSVKALSRFSCVLTEGGLPPGLAHTCHGLLKSSTLRYTYCGWDPPICSNAVILLYL